MSRSHLILGPSAALAVAEWPKCQVGNVVGGRGLVERSGDPGLDVIRQCSMMGDDIGAAVYHFGCKLGCIGSRVVEVLQHCPGFPMTL